MNRTKVRTVSYNPIAPIIAPLVIRVLLNGLRFHLVYSQQSHSTKLQASGDRLTLSSSELVLIYSSVDHNY